MNINEVRQPIKDVSKNFFNPLVKEAITQVPAMPIKKAPTEVTKSTATVGVGKVLKEVDADTSSNSPRPMLEQSKQPIIEKSQAADKSRYYKYSEPQKASQ